MKLFKRTLEYLIAGAIAFMPINTANAEDQTLYKITPETITQTTTKEEFPNVEGNVVAANFSEQNNRIELATEDNLIYLHYKNQDSIDFETITGEIAQLNDENIDSLVMKDDLKIYTKDNNLTIKRSYNDGSSYPINTIIPQFTKITALELDSPFGIIAFENKKLSLNLSEPIETDLDIDAVMTIDNTIYLFEKNLTSNQGDPDTTNNNTGDTATTTETIQYILPNNDYSDVMIIANKNAPSTLEVAEYFKTKRNIPDINYLLIDAPNKEEIRQEEYDPIEQEIENYILNNNLENKINYIVTIRINGEGVPLKIQPVEPNRPCQYQGDNFINYKLSAFDSELTIILHPDKKRESYFTNPYYKRNKKFSFNEFNIFLVTSIIGHTNQDAISLIDRAEEAMNNKENIINNGKILLNKNCDLHQIFESDNQDILNTYNNLKQISHLNDIEMCEDTIPYFWKNNIIIHNTFGLYNSHIRYNKLYHLQQNFLPGAMAICYESLCGRTTRAPPQENYLETSFYTWPEMQFGPYGELKYLETPDNWEELEIYNSSSKQLLVGMMVEDGITITAGAVYEPYTTGLPVPETVFPSYAKGFNAAESMYLGLRMLSWQTFVIGDPKCAPYEDLLDTDN